MKEIQLTQGKVALVDDEDYEYLNQFKWHVSNDNYARRTIYKDKLYKALFMHREIMKVSKGLLVDHINGNRGDNRLCNLRDVSRKINTQNRKSASINNSCGLLGVSEHKGVGKSGRFVAGIYIEGKRKHLGVFDTAQQAHEAYLTAKRKYHEGCTI